MKLPSNFVSSDSEYFYKLLKLIHSILIIQLNNKYLVDSYYLILFIGICLCDNLGIC